MKVSDAIVMRRSVRAYLETPVPVELVRHILSSAHRAPSGGNLQPWHVWALTGEHLQRFNALIAQRSLTHPAGEPTEYKVYPDNLVEPYRSRRFSNGEDLYRSLGIPRKDKPARFRQLARNFSFFGAPVGLVFSINRQMQSGQWADLGMYIQSVMLLAVEHGLGTCAQEAWTMWHGAIREFVRLPDDQMVFCGMALGHADPGHPINGWKSARAPESEFLTLLT